MKIITWNVNGIRAAAAKGMLEWMSRESPDIVCFQEVKAHPGDIDPIFLEPFGYKSFWAVAEKKGYSGVTTFSKKPPLKVEVGLGIKEFDSEGRTVITHFEKFILINAYFPNSQREHTRLPYKLKFCNAILEHCENLVRKKKKNIIICGDFNIAHKEIDLKNPTSNRNNAGFLPEERAWLDLFVEKGYVDVFRHFCKDSDKYTWWSYRPGIRERNVGWRIDYHFVNKDFLKEIKNCEIHPEILGSDHCPVSITLR